MPKERETFEAFQMGREWEDDLSQSPVADASLEGIAGYTYDHGTCYIEEIAADNAARAKGRWYLILHQDEWITDDLEALERRLYQWGIDQGIGTDYQPDDDSDDYEKPHETNVEMLVRVCEFARTGALAQLFAIDAISQWATLVLKADPSQLTNALIDGKAWQAAAREWQQEIAKHGGQS